MAVSRSTIPASVRHRVLFNGRCAYCGIAAELVVDHVIPHSRGGSDAEWNLAPACEPCNIEKGDNTPDEWRTWRERAGLPWPVEHDPADLKAPVCIVCQDPEVATAGMCATCLQAHGIGTA